VKFQLFVRSSLQRSGVIRSCLLSALIACAAVNTTTSYAAGLGPLKLHSNLGQHLDAEIEVTGVNAEDLKTLSVYMASTEVFEQMGIPVPSVLQHIRFDMETESVAGARVILSSVEPIREPFINLVVELSWADGTYLREFTFLLDPVLLQRSSDSLAANSAALNQQVLAESEPSIETDFPAESSETQPLRERTVDVKRGDNLFDIARSYKPARLSIEQTAMAIYDRNPAAFFGSVHKLKRGATLAIPEFDQVQLRTRQSARQLLGITASKRLAKVDKKKSSLSLVPQEVGAQDTPEVEFVENVHEMQDSVSSIDAKRAVAAVSQNLGANRRVQNEPSVNALQTLIGELRGAMVGLGQELQRKTTQLDDISERVDHLQQQQAITTNVAPVADAVGSLSAIKAAPASAATEPVPKLGDTPSATEQTATPNRVKPVAVVVEPIAMLDQKKQLQAETQNKTTDKQRTESRGAVTASLPAPIVTADDNSRVEVEKEKAFAWFFDADQNEKVAGRIRDAGLLSLAFLLGIILVKKMVSSVRLIDADLQKAPINGDSIALDLKTYPADVTATSEAISPLSTIEYFRSQLTSEQHKEQALKDTLSESPDRHDVRLELLKLYHERGAVEMFAENAREMYNSTQGKTPEWHAVIEMGLALDADMSFYKEPEDHGFTFNEEFAVSGARISSVSGGKSVGQRPSSQQTEDRQPSVKIRDNNPQAGLDEFVEANGPIDEFALVSPYQDKSDDFEVDAESAGSLDIDFDDHSDESVDQTLNEVISGNVDETMSLDEVALDEVVWKDEGDDGLSDAQMAEHLNLETQDDNEGDSNSSTQDLISNLDSIHDLDSVVEFDQSSTTEEIESSAPDELAENVSSWKESEVRLELAVVYIDMGNKDGAWDLLDQVLKEGDAAQILVAEGLMSKLR